MSRNKSDSRDTFADELMDIFSWAYDQQSNDLVRLSDMQSVYDNVIDDSVWPTISKIPIASAWAAVEEEMGPSMDYLFPPQPFTKIIPLETTDNEVVHNMEWALYLMMIYRMNIKRAVLRSVKDSFKVSVGYGIVEPVVAQSQTVFEIVAGNNRTKQMGYGQPSVGLRFRYISPGKIVPYPSGTDFNGQDVTPYAFFLDLYPAHEFKALYDQKGPDDKPIFTGGSPNDIIEECRTKGFNSKTSIGTFVDKMAGRRTQATTQVPGSKGKIPPMVPILKVYQPGRQTWLFCGKTPRVVFDDQGYTASRCPLIKFDPWLDADRWFPMSQPEADMRMVMAKNTWFNMLFDLATWAVKRPLLYDSQNGEEAPEFGPRSTIGIPGNVNNTARFLDPPGIDQGSIQIGAEVDNVRTQLTGQRDLTSKNFTRGGTMSFQGLLNEMTGRQRFRHALLQLGGFRDITVQTLRYMQIKGGEMDLRFNRPTYSAETGREETEQFSVEEDDLKAPMDVLVDLDAKHRYGGVDQQSKFAAYDRKKDNPYFDQHEVARDLCDDEFVAQRQVRPREDVKRIQAEREAAEQQGIAAGLQRASPSAGAPALSGAEG